MSQLQQASPSVLTWPRVVFGLLFLVAVACLVVGSALQSSMSGEFPSDGATASEAARWAWGTSLARIGSGLALVWAVLVVVLRKQVGLRLAHAVGVAVAGVFIALLFAFVACVVFLA